MTKKYTARCACNAVQFEFDTDPDFIAVCHCLDCKKASGGEAATWFGVPDYDFTVTAGAVTAYPYVAASGAKLNRNFCPACGSRLFSSELESFPGQVFVQLGSLDHPEAITPKLEMFVKRRLPWVKSLGLPEFSDMPH